MEEYENTLKDKIEDILVYLHLFRLYDFLRDLPKETKWFFQSLFRGYSDADLWSFKDFTLRKIRKPFKAFVKYQREYGAGCPIELFDNKCKDNECHRWQETLEKIELAFDLLWEDRSYLGKDTIEVVELKQSQIKDGLALFARHFQGLWD